MSIRPPLLAGIALVICIIVCAATMWLTHRALLAGLGAPAPAWRFAPLSSSVALPRSRHGVYLTTPTQAAPAPARTPLPLDVATELYLKGAHHADSPTSRPAFPDPAMHGPTGR